MAKKTDRRTLYTEMVIKDAMLELLAEKPYPSITVTDICRVAEISRGTLYLHYKNSAEILEELFEDALNSIGASHVFHAASPQCEADSSLGYPLCEFLRENRKYRPLFFADSLRSAAIERLLQRCEHTLLSDSPGGSGLSETVLRALLLFQLNGCFAVCQNMIDLPDEQWSSVRQVIDVSMRKIYEHLAVPHHLSSKV